MSENSSAPAASDPAPPLLQVAGPVREVRLAVVMYGGVSLAIYINGVTEELYRLVQSTAADRTDNSNTPLFPDGALTSSSRVYRKIGRMLQGRLRLLAKQTVETDAGPIATRFVVDVLSGTSAGGINAVFLAKALANNQPLDDLKNLWFTEADAEVLINDRRSIKVPSVDRYRTSHPESLLNGRRMYRELFGAFEAMDGPPESRKAIPPSPYVEELDLFVTATDLHGRPISITLPGKVTGPQLPVNERQHRAQFHFRYRNRKRDKLGPDSPVPPQSRNDFRPENNPFLAFVARATSAFPVAFEPIRLADSVSAIRNRPHLKDHPIVPDLSWSQFYRAYLPEASVQSILGEEQSERPQDATAPQRPPDIEDYFWSRPFADGGYLDNKPFGYAIDAIATRRARVPVDRKLVFIDPSPERLSDRSTSEKVTFLDNAAAALTRLPRYETIREDLQRILDRNRTIDRLHGVTDDVIRVIEEANRLGKIETFIPISGAVWAKQDLSDSLKRYGPAYGGYHSLKVSATTDDIAELVTRVAGFAEHSDEFLGIRLLVRSWRVQIFTRLARGDLRTENAFLIDFDVSYRLRRLRFVLQKLNRMLGSDSGVNQVGAVDPLPEPERPGLMAAWDKLDAAETILTDALRRLSSNESPLLLDLARTHLFGEDLRALVTPTSQKAREEAADLMLLKRTGAGRRPPNSLPSDPPPAPVPLSQLLAEVATVLQNELSTSFRHARKLADEALPPVTAVTADTALGRLRQCYDKFEVFDLLLFPLTYCSPTLGEADVVDVIRISPDDAVNLVDRDSAEKRRRHLEALQNPDRNPQARQAKTAPSSATPEKLAGTAFMNFGAFLDLRWRKNDRLWGRLDAAEQLITSLVPVGDDCKALVDEAQIAILKEEFATEACRQFAALVWETFIAGKPGREKGKQRQNAAADAVSVQAQDLEAARERINRGITDPATPGYMKMILEKCQADAELLAIFRDAYATAREPNPQSTLRNAGRAVRVLGQMFEGLTENRARRFHPGARVLTSLGTALWGLVEIAVPDGFWSAIARRWLAVLYICTGLLITGAWILGVPEALRVGWSLLIALFVGHVIIVLAEAYLHGQKLLRAILSTAALLLAVLIFGLIVLGVQYARLALQLPGAVEQALDADKAQLATWLVRAGGVALIVLFLAAAASIIVASNAVARALVTGTAALARRARRLALSLPGRRSEGDTGKSRLRK